jgi:hypothetical protein
MEESCLELIQQVWLPTFFLIRENDDSHKHQIQKFFESGECDKNNKHTRTLTQTKQRKCAYQNRRIAEKKPQNVHGL